MKLVWIVVLLQGVLSQNPNNQDQFRCDYEYSKEAGGWLKFQEIPANWHEARIRCRFEGATLASPTAQLKAYLQRTVQTNPTVCDHLYTGISATYASGDYASVEGVPLSDIPHNWSHCQPSGRHKKDCVAINKLGELQDVNCTEAYPYVCYKKFASIKLNPCGTIDDGYVLDSRTGSCYKFHQNGHSWDKANIICRAEGGHLAIVNSDMEARVLSDIFARVPGSAITSNWKDHALVGFRDWDEHAEWYTIQGQSLAEAGYSTLARGYFDNAFGVQYCGCIDRNGLLDDIECDKPCSFICEKDPKSLQC